MNVKKRIFEIMQIGNNSDFASNLYDFGFVIMVFTNLFITIFETFDCSEPYLPVLNVIELITVIFFPQSTYCAYGQQNCYILTSNRVRLLYGTCSLLSG